MTYTIGVLERISIMADKLKDFVHHLRVEHRLKKDVDYSFTIKYGILRGMINERYSDIFYEHAKEFGIEINTLFWYFDEV